MGIKQPRSQQGLMLPPLFGVVEFKYGFPSKKEVADPIIKELKTTNEITFTVRKLEYLHR